MGLNCTHGCWDGPYSYFNTFREWIAKQVGIDLRSMLGFKEGGGGIPWDGFDHPIIPLLNHSDCDGELTIEECHSIIKGAYEILEKIPTGEYNEFADALYKFATGCESAVELNEHVNFY